MNETIRKFYTDYFELGPRAWYEKYPAPPTGANEAEFASFIQATGRSLLFLDQPGQYAGKDCFLFREPNGDYTFHVMDNYGPILVETYRRLEDGIRAKVDQLFETFRTRKSVRELLKR